MKLSSKVAALVVVALAALGAASCSRSPHMSLEEMPVPPGARMGVSEGAYEVKIDGVTAEVRRALAEKYGPLEVALYTLVPDAEWKDVSAFYETHLAARGFKRDTGFPAEHASHKLAVLADESWFGKSAVAVAFIEAGQTADGVPLKFLAVFVTKD